MHPDKSLKRMLHSRDRQRMHMWLVALCSLTTDVKAIDSQPRARDAPVPAYGDCLRSGAETQTCSAAPPSLTLPFRSLPLLAS